MGKINILPPGVFNRIAAGEVVDRPYSVVKELVENAIDSGATEIEIQIEKGGKRYISVRDNGEGIEYSDLKSLFLPHATSKISCAADLENINSLGFRGEAVASIASVSRMRYTSAKEGADCYRIECNGGEIGEIQSVATGGKGTFSEVIDLFYNTPVRLKFLKSDKAEESDISTFVNRFMLSHPHIAFKYYIDNRLAAKSLGEGEEVVLAAVYGPSILANTYHINGTKNGISVRGYISNQNFFKPNHSYQSVFLNGRFIVNATISAALTNAYASYAMKRQYPFYVLYITVPPEVVDVNVHPNKADVRFADNQVVYSAVYGIVSAVLDGNSKGMEYLVQSKATETVIAAQPPKKKVEEPQAELLTDERIEQLKARQYDPFEKPEKPSKEKELQFMAAMEEMVSRKEAPQYDFEDVREEVRKAELEGWKDKSRKGPFGRGPAKEYSDLFFKENTMRVSGKKAEEEDFFAENKRLLEEAEGKRTQTKIDVDKCEYKGNLFNTFLLYELGDSVYIIDQHAAHERLIFNRLQEKMEKREIIQQPMLVPYKIHLTPSEDAFLFDCLPALREIGFDIEESGMNRFTINAVPLDLQNISFEDFFGQFLRDLSGLQQIKLENILRDKLAMMACKAAIKGGMTLTKEEVMQLIADMNGDITLKCPHGRPAVAVLTKYELEKMFKRIV